MKQHHLDDNKLRDLGELNSAISEMKEQELPDTIQKQIWEKIHPEMIRNSQKLKKSAALKTFFIFYRPQLITACLLLLIISSYLLFPLFTSNQKQTQKITTTESTGIKTLNLNAGGKIRSDPQTKFQVIHATPETGEVFLSRGKVSVSVTPSKTRKRFEIHTKDAVVAVKGTIFDVIKRRQYTKVTVSQGTVWVTPSGKGRKKLILKAGDHATILPLKQFLIKQRVKGIEAFKEQNYIGAKTYLTPYLANQPRDWEIVTIAARIATINQKYSDALKYYTQILEGTTGITHENSRVAYGMLLKKMGKIAEANKTFRIYLKEYPRGTYRDEIKLELE